MGRVHRRIDALPFAQARSPEAGQPALPFRANLALTASVVAPSAMRRIENGVDAAITTPHGAAHAFRPACPYRAQLLWSARLCAFAAVPRIGFELHAQAITERLSRRAGRGRSASGSWIDSRLTAAACADSEQQRGVKQNEVLVIQSRWPKSVHRTMIPACRSNTE